MTARHVGRTNKNADVRTTFPGQETLLASWQNLDHRRFPEKRSTIAADTARFRLVELTGDAKSGAVIEAARRLVGFENGNEALHSRQRILHTVGADLAANPVAPGMGD